ncbi:hypothetical protein TGAM01_v210690 [Trichoderma gamsii]|uniref:Uncharacterized protein n=1 Tax=Trichoderma gamsii TaxID=398673 RepID=A0A2P4Z833_9HYPO|nr:hypothetical protein TGAM01_v210690 [Trichoderma gamsii]PON20459.1 hypothetical protein TGAM01_v210690 [Trichoderma gamsii]
MLLLFVEQQQVGLALGKRFSNLLRSSLHSSQNPQRKHAHDPQQPRQRPQHRQPAVRAQHDVHKDVQYPRQDILHRQQIERVDVHACAVGGRHGPGEHAQRFEAVFHGA